MWVQIIREFIISLEAVLFVVALYLFWKVNKMTAGKFKKIIIWIPVAMSSYAVYGVIVNMLYYLNTVSGDLWIILRAFSGVLVLFSLMMCAYYLKSKFKSYEIE